MFETIRDFLLQGGEVLFIILIATMVLWSLILERIFYLKRIFPQHRRKIINDWNTRSDKSSWFAQKIRTAMISFLEGELFKNISIIKVIVALCPLLGLLGTVTGMIAVFDAMAATGTSNARLMASGISRATIPTMAGMVAALSGIYFGSLLERHAKLQKEKLSESLELTMSKGMNK